MARAKDTQVPHDGFTRLVDAERAWQARLDAARSDAAARVAAAVADAHAAEQKCEDGLPALLDARRAELRASAESAARAAADELLASTERYRQATPELVERIAVGIAGSGPWFAAEAAP